MLSVESDIAAAVAQLKTLAERQQVAFATARALTQTAAEIQRGVRATMPDHFTLRRQWIVQGIRLERATKANLTATVYSRDEFMGLQEFGGAKQAKRKYLAIPTKAVRRTKSSMIAKSDRPKSLGNRAEVITYKGHKWIALKKARAGRSGNDLRLLYLLVPRANVRERLGLRDTGTKTARDRFMANWLRSLEQAVASARQRG